MLKMGFRTIFSLVAVFTFYTCIDPYNPRINSSGALLVIDGLVTDAGTSYTVKLSRTIQKQDASPVLVEDASVSVSDDLGNSFAFAGSGNGIYRSDSTLFRGMAGRTYTLHVLTSDGEEYESDPCMMQPSTSLDSVYFTRDQQLTEDGTGNEEGIRLLLDAHGSGQGIYYRWTYEETWKFRVPNPKKYDFDLIDSVVVPHFPINEFCWKNKKSNEILVRDAIDAQGGSLEKVPFCFIASDKSDRLLIQYSILVRQYSVSKNEYDFWHNIKQVSESGDDIFGQQPYSVESNIHNRQRASEKVLGYFQVSSVSEKRLNIPFSGISELKLPYYHYPCKRIEMAPEDYPKPIWSPPLTWVDLYKMYCVDFDYELAEVIFLSGTTDLAKMVFTTPECADCTLSGTVMKPDFWTDLE